MTTRFSVNGKTVDVKAEADTPLLWVIRDEIGLTGTKFGCGMALCGACTVHVDGVPVRSCPTPVSAVAGKKVSTVESLSPNNTHPLQKPGSRTTCRSAATASRAN
jgi:isoquinoline 1-oxidoreductase subunit alpha